jgi:hypothetical protein
VFPSHQFQKLGIPHTHLGALSYRSLWSPRGKAYKLHDFTSNILYVEHLTPLFLAMDYGFYHLARLLLCNGATLEDPVSMNYNVLGRLLSPLSLRKDHIRFLFEQEGTYMKEIDGEREQISSKLLPRRLFTKGNGHQLFSLTREGIIALQARKLTLIRVIRWVNLIKTFPGIGTLLNHLLLISRWFIVDMAFSVPYYFDALERHSMLNWGGRDLLSSTYASKMEELNRSGVFLQVWKELDRIFPNATYHSRWYWNQTFPQRIPSLITLAACFNARIPTHKLQDMVVALPTMTAPTEENNPFSSRAPHRRGRVFTFPTQDIVDRAVGHLCQKTIPNKLLLSFSEVFFANDYDILPPHSPEADTLYNLGYRHAALYFFELYLIWFLIGGVGIGLLLFYPFGGPHGPALMNFPMFTDFPVQVWLHKHFHVVIADILEWTWTIGFTISWFLFWGVRSGSMLFESFIRVFARIAGGFFLIPMLRGRVEYSGFTARQYSDALSRSVTSFGLCLAYGFRQGIWRPGRRILSRIHRWSKALFKTKS